MTFRYRPANWLSVKCLSAVVERPLESNLQEHNDKMILHAPCNIVRELLQQRRPSTRKSKGIVKCVAHGTRSSALGCLRLGRSVIYSRLTRKFRCSLSMLVRVVYTEIAPRLPKTNRPRACPALEAARCD